MTAPDENPVSPNVHRAERARPPSPAGNLAALSLVGYAVRLSHVGKIYHLYPGMRQMALDQLGYYRFRFWRPRPQFPEFHALRDISLTINKGDRVGIVGRNGAGKTTLLKLITGNFAPTHGTVEVNGSVQALMQMGLGFHPDLSGYENISSAMVYSGLAGRELDDALADVVDFVELGEFLHQPMNTYSMGMQARLQFAAATAIYPDILIVDEIMGAGDAYFAAKSADRMKRLTSSGCTLLLVSHSTQQVLEFCDRAIWLDGGSVRETGKADTVIRSYEDYMRNLRTEHVPARAAQRAGDPSPAVISRPPTRMDGGALAMAQKQFIRQTILQREPVDLLSETEIEVTLTDGRTAYRWPGRKGLKITGIGTSVKGNEGGVPMTGDSFTLLFTLKCEDTRRYRTRYFVTGYDMDGTSVCRCESPVDEFQAKSGETRSVSVVLSPLLLGWRDYLLSIVVIDQDEIDSGKDEREAKLDLLSRSVLLSLIPTNDGTSPYLHYPGWWYFGSEPAPQPSRITGWQ